MTTKSLFLFIASAGTSAAATAAFRVALRERRIWRENVMDLIASLASLALQPMFVFGFVNFIAANVLWMVVLATQPLSVAYPMQISLIILFNAVISVACFSERMTPVGMIGLGCVLLGVVLMRAEAAP
jgi:multidrug transporter EmrE-like cation transporter